MARPAKRNCDYFPHFVFQERDLYFIETRFGLEGYYFFYRLREFLCQCDDLTYNIDCEADLAYFYKHFALDKGKVQEMMDACADNGIIDQNLWYRTQIVWQDDLASILRDAWKGRKTPPPEKPMVEIEEQLTPRVGVSKVINPVSGYINPVSDPINTQIKGKENKVDENRTNQIKKNKNILDDSENRSVSSVAPLVDGQQETEQDGENFQDFIKGLANDLKSRNQT